MFRAALSALHVETAARWARARDVVSTASRANVTVIRPPRGWFQLELGELWQYRELLFFLVWRHVKIKYKQTVLGLSWAVLGPLAYTAIFTVIFGKLAKLPSGGQAPNLFYMAGMVIWMYFSTSVTATAESLVGASGMLTKIYFPRLLLPFSTCITGLVDFSVGLVALIALMLLQGVVPPAAALLLPVLILIAMGTALGVGLFFAALNVKFRDVRVLLPFVTRLWLYGSVLLPIGNLPDTPTPLGVPIPHFRFWYSLNPMAGVVEAFRWCLLHHTEGSTLIDPWPYVGIGAASMIVMLVAGILYFKRVENQFADIV